MCVDVAISFARELVEQHRKIFEWLEEGNVFRKVLRENLQSSFFRIVGSHPTDS